MLNDRKYIVSYSEIGEGENVNIITFTAMKEFGEVGEYTEEEAREVVKYLNGLKSPFYNDERNIGAYKYKTHKEWDGFVENNKKQIKILIDAFNNRILE